MREPSAAWLSAHCRELHLRARRLGTRKLHDVGKRRQNLGRLLRRRRLNQRLPRMRRVQRLGKNGLPRVKRIGAALGRRLRQRPCGRGLSARARRAGSPENPSRDRTRSISVRGEADNCARAGRMFQIGGGNRIRSTCNSDRGRKRQLRKSLLDPAIAKVRIAERTPWAARAPNERDQAGNELASHPVFSRANRGAGSSAEESNETATSVLSCK